MLCDYEFSQEYLVHHPQRLHSCVHVIDIRKSFLIETQILELKIFMTMQKQRVVFCYILIAIVFRTQVIIAWGWVLRKRCISAKLLVVNYEHEWKFVLKFKVGISVPNEKAIFTIFRVVKKFLCLPNTFTCNSICFKKQAYNQ